MFLKILGKVSYFLFILFVITTAIAQLLAFPAGWIRPDETNLYGFLSMIEPFLFLANLFFAILMVLLWKKIFYISFIAVLVSLFHIGSYYSLRIAKEYEATNPKSSKNSLRLLTYNVKNFSNSLEFMDSSLSQIEKFKPDILSIQEFVSLGDDGIKLIETKFPQLKYHVSNKGLKGKLSSEFGILIFSKYPLRNPNTYEDGDKGIALISDAVIDYRDTVRLFALHLNSTGYNALSHEKSIESYMSDSVSADNSLIVKKRAVTLFNTISTNAILRSYQADTIRQKIEESPYKTIVMGDFNDTPYSYAIRTIMGDTHIDPFREVVRNKYGYSYNLLHKLFRIDYILPDGRFYEVSSYDSYESKTSDHNPVMVTLRPKSYHK